MQSRSAEVKAGLVVLVASGVLVALLLLATGGRVFGHWRTLTLWIEPGALAPRAGDPINVGGVEVGKVKDVAFRTEVHRGDELTSSERQQLLLESGLETLPPDAAARVTYVLAVAEVRADLVVPVGTAGKISETITGSRNLRLVPGLSRQNLSDEEIAKSPIRVLQSPGLTEIAERADEVAEDLKGLIGEARTTFQKAGAAADEARDTISSLRKNVIESEKVKQALDDVAAATASLRATATTLGDRIGGIADGLTATLADFRRMAASGAHLAENADKDVGEILGRMKTTTGRLDAIVAKAGPKLDAFLDDVGRVGTNLAALSDDLRSNGPRVSRLLEGVGTDVHGLMNLLTDAGQNLVDATEKIRSQPWVLLNEPSGEEVAFDNLRATMQSYVRAMERMDRAAATVRDALRSPPADPEAQALLRRALASFQSSVEDYHALEERLTRLLEENAPRASSPRASSPPGASVPAGSSGVPSGGSGASSPPPPPPPPPPIVRSPNVR